jgi:hypothetical protein
MALSLVFVYFFVVLLLSRHNIQYLFSLEMSHAVLSMTVALCVSGGGSDSQNGNTALMWVAARGLADCMRLLIDAGADKEAKDNVRCWTLHNNAFCF